MEGNVSKQVCSVSSHEVSARASSIKIHQDHQQQKTPQEIHAESHQSYEESGENSDYTGYINSGPTPRSRNPRQMQLQEELIRDKVVTGTLNSSQLSQEHHPLPEPALLKWENKHLEKVIVQLSEENIIGFGGQGAVYKANG